MPGSFLLTGNSAGLLHAHRLVAAPGAYLLTGHPAILVVAKISRPPFFAPMEIYRT